MYLPFALGFIKFQRGIFLKFHLFSQGPSNPKKLHRESKVKLPEDICFLSAMQALTSDQLISIIRQVVNDHPDIEKVI